VAICSGTNAKQSIALLNLFDKHGCYKETVSP
jgi:hypothetical protein